MNFKEKTFIIAGMGISGQGAVSLLKNEGCRLILFDNNTSLDTNKLINSMGLTPDTGVYLGELPNHVLKQADFLVLSPGISMESDFVQEARSAGVRITGEIELAGLFNRGRIIAITGTNGKTTTTALTGAIMKAFQEEVFVVGNIGTSFAATVLQTTSKSVTVAEISSFQLETASLFCPDVSAVLNVTPDHLDRHHSMENYLETKMKIAANQGGEDYCILNYEDDLLRAYAPKLKCKVMFFSSQRKTKEGIWLEQNKIMIDKNGENILLCKTEELNLLGKHNFENVMAAAAVCLVMKVPIDTIRRAILCFQSVEHRIEYVATKNGVAYYNDSKGTNTDAAIKAVNAMPGRTILIAGGYDKGADFSEWVESFDGKVKSLILMGATGERIAETARRYGYTDIQFAESMEEAVQAAAQKAEAGETVLLSPACASWGMFSNYEERGNQFKDLVSRL